ncbi:MAG: peptide ABC transporter substrate-binding protein [Gemmatimonadetes bacterium]|nr:peptide ABC transporter substrate-binding protein [Gemmatimonadota bacterium]
MIAPGRRTSTRPASARTRDAAARVVRGVRTTLLLVAGLAVSACRAPERPPGTAVLASGADLESGNPLVTVHPLSRQVQRHALYVTLVRLDSLLQPQPYYAQSWTWRADRRAVTFALAPDLRWHDGTPTTASDVVFTFDAVRDSLLGSPRRADAAVVDSVRAIDAQTVQLVFRAPLATLPPLLAELPLVPAHLLDTVPRDRWRAHPFSTAPVGNGPFRFVSRDPGRRWRFARNADFPASLGGPPTLSQLVVTVVDEAATKFAGLVSGELDLAGVSPAMAHLVTRDSTLALVTPPALFSTVLAFNTTRAPFDDVRVRRAIALAIDRRRLVEAAVAGFGTPAASAIPPGLPASPRREAPQGAALREAQQRADSLLDAAGWRRGERGVRARDGRPLAVELLTVGGGDQAVEQLVQADLAARGITLTIRVRELASFLATLRADAKAFDLAFTGIPGDIALGHLSALFDGAQRGGALDYTGYHHAALDAALAAARRAEPDQAAGAWLAVDMQLAESAPVAWLYHARGVQGRARRLEGVTMDLRGELVTVARWRRRE